MDVKDFENILNAQAQQPAAPAAPAATSQGSAWDGQLGQTVTLSGTARDAAMGAVVRTSQGTVYVLGVESWPDDVQGKTVTVTGTLQRRKLAPDPVVGADGGVSHGAAGSQVVVEDARWSLAGEAS